MILRWAEARLGETEGASEEIRLAVDVFKDTRNAYTLGLLSSLPRSDGGTERLVPIPGAPPNLLAPPEGDPFAPRNPYATERCYREVPELLPVANGHPEHLAAAWYDLPAVANV